MEAFHLDVLDDVEHCVLHSLHFGRSHLRHAVLEIFPADRDVPHFEMVVGLSLGGAARLRMRPFPPRRGGPILVLPLERRSAYVLKGESRWGWQHGIAPTPELRYSITFRTRRDAR